LSKKWQNPLPRWSQPDNRRPDWKMKLMKKPVFLLSLREALKTEVHEISRNI
jgi:hypothetical protein